MPIRPLHGRDPLRQRNSRAPAIGHGAHDRSEIDMARRRQHVDVVLAAAQVRPALDRVVKGSETPHHDVVGSIVVVAVAGGLVHEPLAKGLVPLKITADRIVSANAYIGSEGQIEALDAGADVIITGRATDNSVYVAPMVHELGWSLDDWDKMAAAVTIGHIIECSAGCAGGMSNFWKDIEEPWRVAFPIAEVQEDGDAIITKAPGSGRMVTEWTVKEHLVYEVHDPKNYLMADAVADFSEIRLQTEGPDRVKVSGFRGKPRPETLKLCLGYTDGWLGESEISVCWPDAYEKAQFCERFLRGRFEALEIPVVESRFDYIGLNSIHGPLAKLPCDLAEVNEVRVRVAVKTTSRKFANQIRREVTHLWTHGPVGTTAVISPPPPREIISLWPTLIPRDLVRERVEILEVS